MLSGWRRMCRNCRSAAMRVPYSGIPGVSTAGFRLLPPSLRD